jgi:hypothetical protein
MRAAAAVFVGLCSTGTEQVRCDAVGGGCRGCAGGCEPLRVSGPLTYNAMPRLLLFIVMYCVSLLDACMVHLPLFSVFFGPRIRVLFLY